MVAPSSSPYPSLCLFLAAGAALSQSPVYVLNKHSQLVTSSTLIWVSYERKFTCLYKIHVGTISQVPAENGSRPVDSVVSSPVSFVCRASQRGGGSFHAGR